MAARLTLDHLVIAARTLAEGAAYVREALGVEMPPGGAHPLMGTHNLLMSLGGECYLEVIAIDPGAPVPDHPRWYMLDSFDGAPRLQTWVTATKDMSVASADAHPTCGPARLQSRGDLTWQITVPEDGSLPLEGAYPSIIAWDQGLAPVDRMADLGCRLMELHVAHPKAAEIEARLRDQLDLTAIRFRPATTMRLRAVIATPDGTRSLG